MIVVAITAFALGGWGTWRRYLVMEALSKQYRDRASEYFWPIAFDLGDANDVERMVVEKRGNPDLWPGYSLNQLEDLANSYRKRLDYKKAMANKYENAALRPWLPVEPDPPEPD
jgi:hypothetical protein